MTHTLHRQGSLEELQHDYVIFAMPSSGLTSAGSKPKLDKVFEILSRHNPVNIGDSKGGSRFSLGSDDKVKDIIVENELVHGVFRSQAQVIAVLKDLKEADLGLCITVSGLMHEVEECCGKAGLAPHTIVNSLGIWGRTDLLPSTAVQEITTMCGHGLVSFNLITELAAKVKRKEITPENAAKILAKPCICGVFNPARAAELIEHFSD